MKNAPQAASCFQDGFPCITWQEHCFMMDGGPEDFRKEKPAFFPAGSRSAPGGTMKKRLWLGIAVLTSLLFLVSCVKVEYEAYVTVVNIGNMPMTAWVDGDRADIAAYDSLTWAIPLETENEVRTVYLEAEPQGGGDYDEAIVDVYGDRDVVTWLTGWDLLAGANRTKKKSSLLRGPAPAK
jgi:hypothetical protein